MRKTLLSLGIASLFAAPAFAQTPGGIQVYGRLNLGLDSYQAKGAAAGAARDFDDRLRVFDTASRVGLRGTEDLGNGWRAIYQIETGVNADSGNNLGQNGINNPNTGFWASRDSWVGIEGDRFGRLTFGRQSAYWSNGTIEQIGANYINASSPLANYSQSGIMSGPVARESNTAQYSLRFGGFSATASYGHSATSIGNVSQYEAAQAGVKPRDQFYAFTVRYNHAVFDLQADYGLRKGIVNQDGREAEGFKIGGAWKYMPGSQVSLIYQNLKDKDNFGLGVAIAVPAACSLPDATPAAAIIPGLPGTVGTVFRATGAGGSVNGCDDLKQDSWLLSWEQQLGNFQLLAQYGWSGDVKGSTTAAGLPDSDTQTYLIGGRYFLSKRTWIYASYNQIKNGRNNYTDYWAAWMTSANQLGLAPGLPATSSGADPRIIAVGLFHSF